ncbi:MULTISPECIES: YfhE family protein [Bacillaceae]|uniref:YfhE family protein n=1 Tax=Evansella alkalicola TaxID=745819 RepID=A0ABS6JNM0_9BACI|nr:MULTISPECIES: YfhE family protein [Bacillaceae]MBU9719857.1 YfhE family protein [Bacillus alkalicola]
MESKKRRTKEEHRTINKTQEVLYQSDFKAADREYQRAKGNGANL